nr:putative inorganic carbon transporter subunit DabA [uncultured Dyadobacter sp.]
MNARKQSFDEHAALQSLKHFLPAADLPDRVLHRNPLRAFQRYKFHNALHQASEIFGYCTLLSPDEYRSFYNARKINPEILEKVILERKGPLRTSEWRDKVLMKKFHGGKTPRIGRLRTQWKTQCRLDLNAIVHPTLFRILCSYLDQGVSVWKFPVHENGFLAALREIEANSFTSVFRTPRARNLLLHTTPSIGDLLEVVVGDELLFGQYLFDQQFAHHGWSGMVSAIEDQSETLPYPRKISLHELVIFELLMEIDALDAHFPGSWAPLAVQIRDQPEELFSAVQASELSEVQSIWQEALEWSYYDQVFAEIKAHKPESITSFGQTTVNDSGGHSAVNNRSLLFEPYPGLNLATHALCIVGRHRLTSNLDAAHHVLLHAYNYEIDLGGDDLIHVLRELIPAQGGINLGYFFSRNDNQKLGTGTRFLHQVMGFFGISNSMESDLRWGLSSEEVGRHDPVRLLVLVEHFPETVMDVIQRLPGAFEWFINEWVHLAVLNPETQDLFVFRDGEMIPYKSYRPGLGNVGDPATTYEYHYENLPFHSTH